jgi:hypothetical protein
VAVSGFCVDDTTPKPCQTDDQCAPGQRCSLQCIPDPNCPACDVCIDFAGSCIDVEVPCSSDVECRAGELCALPGGDPAPCVDADGDGSCDAALPPIAPGICVPAPAGCFSDAECAYGQLCRGLEECNCAAVCIDDGNGGCLPCDCSGQPGFCDAISLGDDECALGGACAEGEVCNIYAAGCENAPCEVGPDGVKVCQPCDPIPVGRCEVPPATPCFTNNDCALDEFCASSVAPPCDPANGCAGRPIAPPPGVCKVLEQNPCALIRCGPDAPLCIVQSDGSGLCVADPCLGLDCGAFNHCEAQRDGSGLCVADPAQCASDAECTDGLVCNEETLCLPNPACAADPDAICDDACYGYCVPPV